MANAAAPPLEQAAALADIFRFVEAYTPPEYRLEVTLRPFLPDYIPALGTPDAFIKPPRPDGQPDFLGLTVLDEPAPQQSDPALLALQLQRQLRLGGASSSSSSAAAAQPLGWVIDAAQQPQRLDAWIEHVEALHQGGGGDPAAALPRGMPDVEELMQAWPPEVESQLRSGAALSDARQEVDTATFARMCCAVLELPTAGGALLPALHTLFALYLEFKHNPAFRQHEAFEEDGGGGMHHSLLL